MHENKTEEIIKAPRCSGSPGGSESCDGCPYKFREELPKELWGEHGGKYVEGCDTDKIVLDAADLLEKLVAENEALKTKLWPEYCQDMAEYSCPRVVQLRQEIDHLRDLTKMVPRWVSVKERLPGEQGRYLCNVKSFAFPGRTYISILQYDKYGFREGNIYTDDVTHWQPLPEPPSTEEVE